jgi:replicative superfamily II helicase
MAPMRLLIAPTADGKTEAAIFPLLTAMEKWRWSGLSVIYVCPLKALLNNLLPRLERYAAWLDGGPRYGTVTRRRPPGSGSSANLPTSC